MHGNGAFCFQIPEACIRMVGSSIFIVFLYHGAWEHGSMAEPRIDV